MKEPLESSPVEHALQDKKNYASESASKSISANNSSADSTTIVDKKQTHIAETTNFFNLLYSKIPEPHFAYLFTKHGIFSFAVTDETQRIAMALKAIELSDNAIDVWHSVNPVCVEPTNAKRGDETVVSYQIACVVDIDIRSIAHKGDPSKLAAAALHSQFDYLFRLRASRLLYLQHSH